jgi:glycosyltransferase involved in cell wall biosynthesis
MERIHVLFLIDVLYSTHGGAEGVLWKMTRLLPPDRYRCSIATFATHADWVVADSFNCPVHLLPIRRTYDWQALKAAVQLGRLIRSERVSIVHSFFTASDLLGGLVAKLSGCPILISSRRDMGYQRSALQGRAYRLTGGMFDQVHTVSDSVRLWHTHQDRLAPEKVVTVYNGVDLEEIDRARKGFRLSDLGLEDASHVVVCVANIRPVKGLDVLVAAAAIVCREIPRARFLVLGQVQDQAYMQRVQDLARELNVTKQVIFAGLNPEVPAVLKACDVFYLPSHTEGLSNAMLEAMACGLPCVASRTGGNSELLEDGRSGYLVPPGDAEAGAQRILHLLRHPYEADQMGAAGRQIVASKFSVEAMIGKLAGLYEGLLKRSIQRQRSKNAGESGPNHTRPAVR